MNLSDEFSIQKKPTETDLAALITKKSEIAASLLIPNRFLSHHIKAGVNPLVDAACYLFSMIGKLKLQKAQHHLKQLHKELVDQINHFHDRAKNLGYSPDFILVSRYALCATLDDVITHSDLGSHGQWDEYRLQLVFNNNESLNYDRFFLILERISKDPNTYIDLMEFMYICLSLGFKGNYRDNNRDATQLDQIIDSLYKLIRAQRGNFNKTLSPFAIKIKTESVKKTQPYGIPWAVIAIALTSILVVFVGLGLLLDSLSNQVYRELMTIGTSILYDASPPT